MSYADHKQQEHHAIAVDEDYSTQHTLVADPRRSMRLSKEGLQTSHLRVNQPEKITHVTAPFSGP